MKYQWLILNTQGMIIKWNWKPEIRNSGEVQISNFEFLTKQLTKNVSTTKI